MIAARPRNRPLAAVASLMLAAASLLVTASPAQAAGDNVVLVVADGVRWQEVFTGADPSLLNEDAGGSWMTDAELRERWWSDDVAQRRARLMPFLWGTIAREGQIYGNRNRGSRAHVTNPQHFSYPGYNEMLVGRADPAIDRNDFGPNPNVTVWEWLARRPGFAGRVQVAATWDTFHDIFNVGRSHLPVHAGTRPPRLGTDPRSRLLDELYRTTTFLDAEDASNAYLHVLAKDVLARAQPRVLFLGYGETDSWAHAGRYDQVLLALHQFDAFVADLWATLQRMPGYRGRTTLIVTTDHGRGSGPTLWKDHGVEQPGSDDIWIAVLGPGVPALGERTDIPDVTQSQVAATVAARVGEDYARAVPGVAPPIADLVRRPTAAKVSR